MANRDIKTTVAIEGESAYRSALKNINSELGVLQSALKATTSEFQTNANTETALAAKVDSLQALYDKQREKVEKLKDALANCQQAQNKWQSEMSATKSALETVNTKVNALDSSTKASGEQWNTYKTRLEAAKATLKNLESTTGDTTAEEEKLRQEIARLETAMQELDDATGGSASEAGKLLQEQKNLETQLTSQQSKFDQATTKANSYAKQLNTAQAQAYDLDTELQRNKGYLDEARNSTDGCATSIDQYGKKVKDTTSTVNASNTAVNGSAEAFQALASILATTGIVNAIKSIASALSDCIDSFTEFEETMSKVEALSGATSSELESLTAIAKEMGATTAYTASEAADALSYMALAGWSTEEMLEGLEPILNLAAASSMDLATASDIVTDYLTAFGLSASDAADFVDMMAYAQANSNTTTSQLGEAYKNCAATAASMGYSVEEVTAVLMTMANAGVKGGEAGTALNTIMTRLATNTKSCADALGEYGVEIYDAEGNMNDLSTILEGMSGIWDDLTDAQQASLAKTIAGTSQYSSLQTIMNGLSDAAKDAGMSFSDYTSALQSCTGTAATQAETMLDNLSGKMTLMDSAADALKTEIGEQLAPALSNLVEVVTNVIGAVTDFIATHEGVVPVLTGLVTALGTFAVGLTTATTAMKLAALAGVTLELSLGPIAIALAAVSAAVGLVTTAMIAMSDDSTESLKSVTEASRELQSAIEDASASYESTITSTAAAASAAQSYIDTLAQLEAQEALTDAEQQKYNQTAALLLNLMPELSGTITTSVDDFGNLTYAIEGGSAALKQYLADWKQTAQETAANDFLESYYTAYNAAYSEWYENQVKLTLAQGELAEATETYNEALTRLRELEALGYGKTQEQTLEYWNLTDALVGYSTAVQDAQSTVDMYTKAVETSEQALADAEESTYEAIEAAEEMTAALEDESDAMNEVSDSSDDLSDSYTDIADRAYAAIESGEGLREAYETLVDEMEALEEEGTETSTMMAEQALAALDLAATVEELGDIYGDLSGVVGVSTETIAEYLQSAGMTVEDFAANVETFTGNVINSFDAMTTSLDMTVQEMAANLTDNITATAEWSDNIALLWNAAVNSSEEGATEFVQYLYDMGPEAAEQVASMCNDVEGTLATFAPLFADAAEEAVTEAALGAAIAAGSVYESGVAAAEEYTSGVDTGDYEDAGEEMVDELTAGASAEASEVEQEAAAEAEAVIAVWSSYSGKFQSAGSQATSDIITGMKAKKSTITSESNKLAIIPVSQFNAQSWTDVGKNLAQGIANGITNNKSKITTAATSAAKAAYTAACKALDINSPSKKGVAIGDFFDQGIAQGVLSGVSDLQDAVTEAMNDGVLEPANSATSGTTYVTNQYGTADDSQAAAVLTAYLPQILAQLSNTGGLTTTQVANALAAAMDSSLGTTATRRARGN